ncbi:hypothetical protein RJ639_001766 [Escallonia herrerae]|uniref:Uncharacterized protein n=1 Tax=Escallonia herrerae TaxID=1293975 RepID=A0AA88XCM5_9ASTE|nr:hypothetical protein RJ639_001766 [Escallonia herrerae]
MLTSLFSSFDALSAEKVGTYCFSRAPAVDTAEDKHAAVSDPKGASSAVEAMKKDKQVGSAPPPPGAVKKPQNGQGQQRRAPRFAVELDGVHCFETILCSTTKFHTYKYKAHDVANIIRQYGSKGGGPGTFGFADVST